MTTTIMTLLMSAMSNVEVNVMIGVFFALLTDACAPPPRATHNAGKNPLLRVLKKNFVRGGSMQANIASHAPPGHLAARARAVSAEVQKGVVQLIPTHLGAQALLMWRPSRTRAMIVEHFTIWLNKKLMQGNVSGTIIILESKLTRAAGRPYFEY